MDTNDIRDDVQTIGKDILDRPLTEEEIKENAQALVDYYEILLEEDCDGDEDAAYNLFNEDFHDKLKEQLEENIA